MVETREGGTARRQQRAERRYCLLPSRNCWRQLAAAGSSWQGRLTLPSAAAPVAAGQKGDSSANSALPYFVSLSMLGLLCRPGRLPCSLRLPVPPAAGAAHGMPLPAAPPPPPPPPLLMLLVEAVLVRRRRLGVLGVAAASGPPAGSPAPAPAEPSSGASRSTLSPSLAEGAAGPAPDPPGERGSHLWLRWVKLAPSRRRLLLRGDVADTLLQGTGDGEGEREGEATSKAPGR